MSSPLSLDNETWWGESVDLLMGYPAGEARPSMATFFCHLHAADAWGVCEAMTDALDLQVPYRVEYRLYRADGSLLHVREDGVVLHDHDGGPVNLIGHARDITPVVVVRSFFEQSD